MSPRMVSEQHSGTLEEAGALLKKLLAKHNRVAVVGRPGIGKTACLRYVGKLDRLLVQTDDMIRGSTWEQQRDKVLAACKGDRWVCEGITAARALRHGLEADAVLALYGSPLRAINTKQSIQLGDQVDRWVREAALTHPAAFHFWAVRHRKIA